MGPMTNGSITICKRCGFSNYDPYCGLSQCEWCGEDPKSSIPPLVIREDMPVRLRAGVDVERLPRLLRKSVPTSKHHGGLVRGQRYSSVLMMRGPAWDYLIANRLNTDIQDIVVGVADADYKVVDEFSRYCAVFSEAEFLELFEPVELPEFVRMEPIKARWGFDQACLDEDKASARVDPLAAEVEEEMAELLCELRKDGCGYHMAHNDWIRLSRLIEKHGLRCDGCSEVMYSLRAVQDRKANVNRFLCDSCYRRLLRRWTRMQGRKGDRA